MKRLFFVSLLLLSLISFAQKKWDNKKNIVYDIRLVDKEVAKTKDNIYFSVYEVTNLQYRTFLDDLKAKGETEKLKTAIVDSVKWKDNLSYNAPLVELYFRHPAYNMFPVVNMSYDGATLFCEWLTQKYNSMPKKKFKKVKFRLPTADEWTFAARGGLKDKKYPWGNNLLYIKTGEFCCVFQHMWDEDVHYIRNKKNFEFYQEHDYTGTLNENPDMTKSVKSCRPNGYGLYNMSGNAAEMVLEKGKSKGGSWKDYGYDVRIDQTAEYSEPNNATGFRFVMEVLE